MCGSSAWPRAPSLPCPASSWLVGAAPLVPCSAGHVDRESLLAVTAYGCARLTCVHPRGGDGRQVSHWSMCVPGVVTHSTFLLVHPGHPQQSRLAEPRAGCSSCSPGSWAPTAVKVGTSCCFLGAERQETGWKVELVSCSPGECVGVPNGSLSHCSSLPFIKLGNVQMF